MNETPRLNHISTLYRSITLNPSSSARAEEDGGWREGVHFSPDDPCAMQRTSSILLFFGMVWRREGFEITTIGPRYNMITINDQPKTNFQKEEKTGCFAGGWGWVEEIMEGESGVIEGARERGEG